jgi:hypothetical protein
MWDGFAARSVRVLCARWRVGFAAACSAGLVFAGGLILAACAASSGTAVPFQLRIVLQTTPGTCVTGAPPGTERIPGLRGGCYLVERSPAMPAAKAQSVRVLQGPDGTLVVIRLQPDEQPAFMRIVRSPLPSAAYVSDPAHPGTYIRRHIGFAIAQQGRVLQPLLGDFGIVGNAIQLQDGGLTRAQAQDLAHRLWR